MRRSTKSRRDEAAFRRGKKVIDNLWTLQSQHKFDLFFFDETGFSCQPSVPYGWQPKGETTEIPSQSSERLNTLGFWKADTQEVTAYTKVGSVNSGVVIECFDDFSQSLEQPSVVVLDQASTHTSHAFQARRKTWLERGLYLYFLPTYSPELNWIENLWRMIKYHWLPLDSYESFSKLRRGVESLLKQIGSSYFMNSKLSPV